MLTGHKLKVAQEMYSSGQYTVAAIAKTLGVSRASIYRHLTPRRRLIKPSRPQASRLPDLLHAIQGSRHDAHHEALRSNALH